ncbi:MAG: WecB/TagA/CpsF family glycosyltransferase [Bacteroidales bacterium]|nr:WecB/TagA/CpsF family glycosyltransferase [Bacteroidales bacterium]
MNTYFNINYEFDKQKVHEAVATAKKGYICVSDGVVLSTANRDDSYREVVNGSLFSICDSSWVPVYLKSIYGVKYEQYCGSDIFRDIVYERKHRMFFLGTDQKTLDALRGKLSEVNPDIAGMTFMELPFRQVEDFDYPEIARKVNEDGARVIWVALGAPKQERFMNRLLPYLDSGVMIGVGAVFNFFSGLSESRCPKWMQKAHLEFIYRIFQNPKKQLQRCRLILSTLPKLYVEEKRKKNSRR